MKANFTIKVNKKDYKVVAEPTEPLLYVLRNQLQLNSPKFGCGLAQCGACMVLLNGKSVPSCQVPVSAASKTEITTLEGLIDDNGKLHKVQQAFVDEQAAQCGYCVNGLIMASVSLLNENPNPSDEEIRKSLNRNICRCGIHSRAIKAVKRASISD